MVGLKCGSGRRRAGEDTRPYGVLRKAFIFAQGRTFLRPVFRAAQCAAPTKGGERSVLSVGAGPRPARGRTLCAPTVETARSHNQDRSPHPSGLRPAPLPLLAFSHFPLTGGIGLPLKGKACGRPRGSPLHKKQIGSVGSANPGAEAEPHQSQFSSRSGPQWGRTGPRSSTPDFARRKDSAWPKG